MMKTVKTALLSAVVALASLACSAVGWSVVRGSGYVAEKTYDVSGFDGVALAGIGTVYVEIGEEEGLRIEAEDNLIEHFRIEVRGSTLHIEVVEFVSLVPTEPVKFYLTAKALNSISVSGSGDVIAPALEADEFGIKVSGSGNVSIDELAADGLDVKVSGSGDVCIDEGEIGDQFIDVSGSGSYTAEGVKARESTSVTVKVTGSGKAELGQLETSDLDVKVSGAGKVNVSGGKANAQRIGITGSGSYQATDLESESANVRVSGSGKVKIWANEYLHARISGSGDVYYRGDPTVEESISGSGDIKSIES